MPEVLQSQGSDVGVLGATGRGPLCRAVQLPQTWVRKNAWSTCARVAQGVRRAHPPSLGEAVRTHVCLPFVETWGQACTELGSSPLFLRVINDVFSRDAAFLCRRDS